MSALVCDFNDGKPCHAEATNVAIDSDRSCMAIVCEPHACELANDHHMQSCKWFVLEKGST